MAVLCIYINLVTKQKLALHVIETGPAIVDGVNANKDKCMSMNWKETLPGGKAPAVGANYMPHNDTLLVTGFPLCESKKFCVKNQSDCRPHSYYDPVLKDCKKCQPGSEQPLPAQRLSYTLCW
eukprot:TRINITY_DN20067_c0_g1_i1.p1 TRINITY_DN20067_c0_g1~~TRINITY_DN20067_c0_g1_i1.p1  ORF type:complete len:123 (+),score=22.10 TRINITY_DN20067_c0_g1_i1:1-369(+)